MIGLLLGAWLSAAGPLEAQETEIPAPAVDKLGIKGKKDKEAPALARALDLVFGPEIWAKVQISTAGPGADTAKLVRAGYYKLEIIQLVLIAAEAGQSLKDVVEKRHKGQKLREIAESFRLDYDKLYETALLIEESVDKDYLPRFFQGPPGGLRESSP